MEPITPPSPLTGINFPNRQAVSKPTYEVASVMKPLMTFLDQNLVVNFDQPDRLFNEFAWADQLLRAFCNQPFPNVSDWETFKKDIDAVKILLGSFYFDQLFNTRTLPANSLQTLKTNLIATTKSLIATEVGVSHEDRMITLLEQLIVNSNELPGKVGEIVEILSDKKFEVLPPKIPQEAYQYYLFMLLSMRVSKYDTANKFFNALFKCPFFAESLFLTKIKLMLIYARNEIIGEAAIAKEIEVLQTDRLNLTYAFVLYQNHKFVQARQLFLSMRAEEENAFSFYSVRSQLNYEEGFWETAVRDGEALFALKPDQPYHFRDITLLQIISNAARYGVHIHEPQIIKRLLITVRDHFNSFVRDALGASLFCEIFFNLACRPISPNKDFDFLFDKQVATQLIEGGLNKHAVSALRTIRDVFIPHLTEVGREEANQRAEDDLNQNRSYAVCSSLNNCRLFNLHLEHDSEKIKKLAHEGFQANPYNLDLHFTLALLFFKKKLYKEAVLVIEKTCLHFAHSPAVAWLQQLAMCHYELENYEISLDYCRRLLKREKTAGIYNEMGMNYSKLGKIDEAIEAFEQGLNLTNQQLSQTFPLLLNMVKLARVFKSPVFDRLTSLYFQSSLDTHKNAAHVLMAYKKMAEENYQGVKEHIEQCTVQDFNTKYLSALVECFIGCKEKALAKIRKIMKTQPANLELRFTKYFILLDLNRFKDVLDDAPHYLTASTPTRFYIEFLIQSLDACIALKKWDKGIELATDGFKRIPDSKRILERIERITQQRTLQLELEAELPPLPPKPTIPPPPPPTSIPVTVAVRNTLPPIKDQGEPAEELQPQIGMPIRKLIEKKFGVLAEYPEKKKKAVKPPEPAGMASLLGAKVVPKPMRTAPAPFVAPAYPFTEHRRRYKEALSTLEQLEHALNESGEFLPYLLRYYIYKFASLLNVSEMPVHSDVFATTIKNYLFTPGIVPFLKHAISVNCYALPERDLLAYCWQLLGLKIHLEGLICFRKYSGGEQCLLWDKFIPMQTQGAFYFPKLLTEEFNRLDEFRFQNASIDEELLSCAKMMVISIADALVVWKKGLTDNLPERLRNLLQTAEKYKKSVLTGEEIDLIELMDLSRDTRMIADQIKDL